MTEKDRERLTRLLDRLSARCLRAENEYEDLAAPDGTVAVPFTDLRIALSLARRMLAAPPA
jgi:hypothetical protein